MLPKLLWAWEKSGRRAGNFASHLYLLLHRAPSCPGPLLAAAGRCRPRPGTPVLPHLPVGRFQRRTEGRPVTQPTGLQAPPQRRPLPPQLGPILGLSLGHRDISGRRRGNPPRRPQAR